MAMIVNASIIFFGKTSIDRRQKIFNDEIEVMSESSCESNTCREINEIEDDLLSDSSVSSIKEN